LAPGWAGAGRWRGRGPELLRQQLSRARRPPGHRRGRHVIVIVLIPLIGKAFIAGSVPENPEHLGKREPTEVIIDRTLPDKNEIDQAIVTVIENSLTNAKSFASAELDNWVDKLMSRVDNSFFPWYFDYINQKKMEFSAPFIYLSSAVSHWINTNNPPPKQVVAEKLTEDFQTEFTKRVLRPRIAQLELERITKQTTEQYLDELSKNISAIQGSYNIPQGQWERYLDEIAVTINDTEGNSSDLSMKVLVGGSSYLLAKGIIIPTATKMIPKVITYTAGKAGAKMAAKTGGAVAAKLGVQFLDPIVGVGIIIWDVWDYNHTVKVDKPILRGAIFDYLTQVKYQLLDNHKDSIMAAVYQLESDILDSIK
ncbi:MAG: hypothetical protein F6K10_42385, partial [Moorea sp. SIO2B7]|nr:hypothetical protein [Moorena sp. SIO2B7]